MEVTFSEAIDAATFDWHDLTLTRDGGANLITDPIGGQSAMARAAAAQSITIQHVSGNTYAITGLESLTEVDGVYVLTVDAAGVEDLFGNAGAGTISTSWTMAALAPGVVSVSGLSDSLRNTAVEYLDITFTEPIQLGTLTAETLSLTLAGANLLSGQALDVVQIDSQTYRLGSLASLTAAAGSYQFAVDLSGIKDLEGNDGVGQ